MSQMWFNSFKRFILFMNQFQIQLIVWDPSIWVGLLKSIQLLVWSGPIHMKSIQTHDANHFYFMMWHANDCLTLTKLIPRWVDWCHTIFSRWLTQLSVVCSLWCVGTSRLTHVDCHTSLIYALDVVSWLCMCVSYNIHVLWFPICVHVCVLCVVCRIKQSLSIQHVCT